MADQAASVTRVEFGAWVEGTESRKDGKGLRKVWVSPAPEGTPVRLGVFTGTRFVFALHADTREECQSAMGLLLDAAQVLDTRLSAPAPVPAPAPARKAPTPPAAPAPAKAAASRQAIVEKARAERKALTVAPAPRVTTPAPAPAKAPAPVSTGSDLLDWIDSIRA